jgi:hypothetical protein
MTSTPPIPFAIAERGFKSCRAALATMLGMVREFRGMYHWYVAATELDRALQARREAEREEVPRCQGP